MDTPDQTFSSGGDASEDSSPATDRAPGSSPFPPTVPPFGGGPVVPPPPQPARSRRGLWTCLVVLLVFGGLGIVCLVAVGWFVQSTGLMDATNRIDGPFTGGGRVGLLRVESLITDASRSLETIRYYAETESIKAVLVRIDSPGGSVGASQEIYQALLDLRKRKEVVISMGNVAASGGYYIACAGREIYTNPGTLTGSIGVILSIPNIEKVSDKIGITEVVLKSGRFKDAGSMVRPMTEEERGLLQGVIDDTYKQFAEAVLESRREALTSALDRIQKDPNAPELGILGPDILPVAGLDAKSFLDRIADGRVVTGRQAKVLGLVDKVGTQADALSALGKMVGIVRPELFEYKPKRSLSDFLNSTAQSAMQGTGLPLRGARLEYRLAF